MEQLTENQQEIIPDKLNVEDKEKIEFIETLGLDYEEYVSALVSNITEYYTIVEEKK